LINVMTKKAQPQRSFRVVSLGTAVAIRTAWRSTSPGRRARHVRASAQRRARSQQRLSPSRVPREPAADLTATFQASSRARFTAEVEFGRLESNSPRTYTLYDSFLLWNGSGRPTFATPAANAAAGVGRNSTSAAAPRVTIIGNDGTVIGMRGTMTTSGNDEILITDTRIADHSINSLGPDRTASLVSTTSPLLRLPDRAHSSAARLQQTPAHRFERFDPA